MHEIERHVLKTLSLSVNARYRDIKPGRIEGNIFTYHLKKLANDGYITSKNDFYKLTPSGKRLVDKMSFTTLTERIQPKIVTILVIEKNERFVFYKRSHSPFKGLIGFPYGKIHMEEKLADAARRELSEKTGLTTSLKHRGDVYLLIHDEEELITHMLCHVFYGKDPKGMLESEMDKGECFWSNLQDVSQKELMPGVKQIMNLVKKSSDHFFAEYFLNVNENN